MTKINRDKIVRAALGSARLEGYKGSLNVTRGRKSVAPKVNTVPTPGDAAKR